MKLYRMLISLVLLVGIAGVLSAAEIEGILMDKMCLMKAEKEGPKAAMNHTRECAVMCEKDGYGIYTKDSKALLFDAAGNKQAVAALKASTKKDNLAVKVRGKVAGDTIKVESLKLQ